MSDSSDDIAQLRRGALELAIFILLEQEPTYGYEIVQRLSRHGPLAAGENTIYPLLRRLKREGYLETRQEPSPAGPPRQIYSPTRSGGRRREMLESEWRGLVSAVDAVGRTSTHD